MNKDALMPNRANRPGRAAPKTLNKIKTQRKLSYLLHS